MKDKRTRRIERERMMFITGTFILMSTIIVISLTLQAIPYVAALKILFWD